MTDQKFHGVLLEMESLHDKKAQDYDGGSYASIYSSEQIGIPAWKGVMVLLGYKWTRLQFLTRKVALPNYESIEDTIIDMAIYLIIMLIMYREKKGKE